MNADPEYLRCSGCGTPERECVCFGICEVCLLLWYPGVDSPCRGTVCRTVAALPAEAGRGRTLLRA